MTYEVQQTRWDRLIRRVSGSIGPGSRVSETISELFPVLDVESVPGELLILNDIRLCWQSTERPGVVGQVSASQLQNPADSGVLISLSQVDFVTDINSIIQAEITETFTGTPVTGLFRDGRLGIARETTGKVSSFDNVATGGGFRVRLQALVMQRFKDENSIAIIGPGQAFQIGTATNNIRFTVNYFWRERAALPSELQF